MKNLKELPEKKRKMILWASLVSVGIVLLIWFASRIGNIL